MSIKRKMGVGIAALLMTVSSSANAGMWFCWKEYTCIPVGDQIICGSWTICEPVG